MITVITAAQVRERQQEVRSRTVVDDALIVINHKLTNVGVHARSIDYDVAHLNESDRKKLRSMLTELGYVVKIKLSKDEYRSPLLRIVFHEADHPRQD